MPKQWVSLLQCSASQGHENSHFSWTGNVALSLCYVLWNVTSLNLSRIFNFKRSWELLTGVSTCLYDMSITWSWNTISEEQAKQIFRHIVYIYKSMRQDYWPFCSPLFLTGKIFQHCRTFIHFVCIKKSRRRHRLNQLICFKGDRGQSSSHSGFVVEKKRHQARPG